MGLSFVWKLVSMSIFPQSKQKYIKSALISRVNLQVIREATSKIKTRPLPHYLNNAVA